MIDLNRLRAEMERIPATPPHPVTIRKMRAELAFATAKAARLVAFVKALDVAGLVAERARPTTTLSLLVAS